jgi:asparagine synthase (glutamine-hydrolysing)
MGDQSLQYFEPNTKRLAGVSTAKAITNHSEFKGRRLTEALLSALGTKGLTPLLRYADRNSMHSSIESRVPFLNKKLVEFTLSLPENYLLSNGGETKHILRKSLEGIVPDSILNRKDKIGFAAETNGLGKSSQMLAKISASLDSVPLINKNESKLAIEDVVSGNRSLDSTLWRLINFSRWHQIENVAS